MPLLLLLIDSGKEMLLSDVRDYALSHRSFFEDFLGETGSDVIAQEFDRILMILIMKGVVGLEGERVFLLPTALSGAAAPPRS
jgi:hypothetical protein